MRRHPEVKKEMRVSQHHLKMMQRKAILRGRKRKRKRKRKLMMKVRNRVSRP
jgi:hypothetical protein